MKLSELKEIIDRRIQTMPRSADYEVSVVTFQYGSIGGSPKTEVIRAENGFDWDNGHFLLYTKDQVQKLTPEEVEKQKQEYKEKHYTPIKH